LGKLADKGQEQVTAAREKAGEVVGENIDKARESFKTAWEQTSEFAAEQKKKAGETIGSVTEQSLVNVEKTAKATVAAARETIRSIEKTAEEFALKGEAIVANDEEREQRIRERAYQIWLDEGQPDGRDKEHWEQAEKQIAEKKEAKPENKSGAPPLPHRYVSAMNVGAVEVLAKIAMSPFGTSRHSRHRTILVTNGA
jgi:hypothetical protein